MEALSVHNLSIGYGKLSGGEGAIFPHFSISANRSEMIALIGRNGVGKSTFLRTLVGLQTPLAGKLIVDGHDALTYTKQQLASLVSYVSTESIRVRNLKVYDLVSLGRYPHTNWLGTLSENDKQLVVDAIAMVGLEKYTFRNISRLSDGELQRVMIARTLAQDTPVIILDEPTAFLDLPNKYEVLLLLRRLAHEKGKTIIFSTHDLSIAMKLADKIWLMANNHFHEGAPEDLALQGTFDELFENSLLSFDKEKGGIDLGLKSTEIVTVNDAERNYWVKRALERAGFEVLYVDGNSADFLLKVDYNKAKMTFIYYEPEQEAISFKTIYDLITYLT